MLVCVCMCYLFHDLGPRYLYACSYCRKDDVRYCYNHCYDPCPCRGRNYPCSVTVHRHCWCRCIRCRHCRHIAHRDAFAMDGFHLQASCDYCWANSVRCGPHPVGSVTTSVGSKIRSAIAEISVPAKEEHRFNSTIVQLVGRELTPLSH